MSRLKRASFWLGLYTALVVAFLIYLPILLLIIFSFNDSKIMSLPWNGFTLRWYKIAFSREDLLHALFNSLWVAAVVTVFSLILGVMAANGMAKYRYKGRSLFTGYIAIPVVMPWLLLGISLLLFFNLIKLPLSLFTVILSHISFDVPLVAVIVAARLHQFDPSLEEAARDLGASALETFRLVTLPIIAPAVIAAGIFAFSWSFDAFVVTHFVIGSQVTFPIWVWSALRFAKNLPVINAISSLIVVVEILIVYVGERLRRGEGEGILF